MKRRVKAVIVVCTLLIFGSFALVMWNTFREKPEILPPQDRWVILEAKRIDDRSGSSLFQIKSAITIKYIGENYVNHVLVSVQCRESALSDHIKYFEETSFFPNGEITFKCWGETHHLDISFEYKKLETLHASFDFVLEDGV